MAQCGITAIEVLIGIAVLTIVALLAVPTSSILMERHYLKSASSNLVDGIYLAKREAEIRASTVRVCPSNDGRTCRVDGDWSQGWLVFSDGNADGVVQEIEVIEAYEAPGGHLRIVASGAAQTAAAFNSAGLVRDNGIHPLLCGLHLRIESHLHPIRRLGHHGLDQRSHLRNRLRTSATRKFRFDSRLAAPARGRTGFLQGGLRPQASTL